MGSIFSIVLRRETISAIAISIVFLFLIYYLSTWAFYKRARSKSLTKTPPVVPFFLPIVFHTFSLMVAGPQHYFAQLLKEFGRFAPFSILVGSRPYVIVRDVNHIKSCLESPEAFPPSHVCDDLLDKLFGLPAAAHKILSKLELSSITDNTLEIGKFHILEVDGATSMEFAETFLVVLSQSMNDKMFQAGTWTQIENTWMFFQQVLSRCMIQALLGTDIFKQYPNIVKDYWKFSEAIEDFTPGMPKYMVTSAATTSQEQLLQGLEKWLKANHSGTDFAQTRDDDPSWDSFKGSKLIQRRDDYLAKISGVDTRARAADLLNVLHCSLSCLTPTAIWTLFEILRRPQLFKDTVREISRYRPSQGAAHNVNGISNIPIIQSTVAEVTRFRIKKAMVRIAPEKSSLIDGNWVISAETAILAFSSDAAMCTEAWLKARQETVAHPLDTFWAERFLISKKAAKKMQIEYDETVAGNMIFMSNGLGGLLMESSEHPHRHLGVDFLNQMLAASLAVLLGEFEMQLCDPEAFDAATPSVNEAAYGTVQPLTAIAVRIRKQTVG